MSVWPSQVIAQENALIQLERHKPLYFLMGRPHTKIQISFKIGLIQRVPIYLGYTQLLIGDLFVADPGFRDVNYNPEIFYRLSLPLADHWIDFSPYEHESNGKGGVLEKAWDRAYLRYHSEFLAPGDHKILWDFKVWVPLYFKQANQDLAQYRGIWELQAIWMNFVLRLYPGGKSLVDPFHGGQELTFSGPLYPQKLVPHLVVQGFHGVGENLSDYKDDHLGFRLGFGF